ncbi:CPBP family intramembrane glutamic endopeptidase [Microbulbifer sp. SAOS-129_SWC]|uniref:CPBP family intramembrane glutamic endopeptidase n=1 Tax=Microbulbifer sp. SAOS-129_SWC TaxID=3145235 RepID=UPI0032177454
MTSPDPNMPAVFPLVIGIELVVLLLALVGIHYAHIPVTLLGRGGWAALALGAAGAALTFAVAVWLTRSDSAAGAALRHHSAGLRALFGRFSWPQIVLAAAAAGICEELLFRAFLQPWLATFVHAALGIVIASILFALLHAASATYFTATLIIGLLFGVVYWWSGSLLLVASWHGLYDLLAIATLVKRPQWLGLAGD